jgi:hypothetical protein
MNFDVCTLNPIPSVGLSLYGFALGDCTVQIQPEAARYLRVVHRTALELAVRDLFGVWIGGYWLTTLEITQLRMLVSCYPYKEAGNVSLAIEAYLNAQLGANYAFS